MSDYEKLDLKQLINTYPCKPGDAPSGVMQIAEGDYLKIIWELEHLHKAHDFYLFEVDKVKKLKKELSEEVEHRKKAVDYYLGAEAEVKKLKKEVGELQLTKDQNEQNYENCIASLNEIQDRQALEIKRLLVAYNERFKEWAEQKAKIKELEGEVERVRSASNIVNASELSETELTETEDDT